MEIKPIETIYNGYKFRSRLEARWAVFFDALGIKYEYENEGYDLGEAGLYLPDFWLPKQDVFIEIRPSIKYMFDIKCAELSATTGKSVLYVAGNPYPNEYGIAIYENGTVDYYLPFEFAQCRRCSGIWMKRKDGYESDGMSISLVSCDDDCTAWFSMRDPMTNGEKILKAYNKARQARFEHGECG